MPIRRLHIWLLCLPIVALTACKADNDTVLPRQQTDFEKFLTATHDPVLVSEQEADESVEQLEFYTTAGGTAYRYIRDYYNTARSRRTEVEKGDIATIEYWIYFFNNQKIVTLENGTTANPAVAPIYTNDVTWQPYLEGFGIDTRYWPFTLLPVEVGAGELMKGADISLAGCREGDFVEIYMTYNMAYGSGFVGVIPKKSPLAFFCRIVNVQKQ